MLSSQILVGLRFFWVVGFCVFVNKFSMLSLWFFLIVFLFFC